MAISKIDSDGIVSGGITADSLNIGQIGGRRNLIINGAMQVAQRGTSSASGGTNTVDRWNVGGNISISQAQSSLSSSDEPYTYGFRNYLRATNTGTTSATNAYAQFLQKIESQNVANSGWNYPSSSSNITLSFWARSSLAGTYYCDLRSNDGTNQQYCFAFTLTANTWTKITKTVPGDSNLVFNNDNGVGLTVHIWLDLGTDYTDSGTTLNSWAAFASGNQSPDFVQKWGNTASATWDITGVQLEVGSVATPFEHRSYGEELALCQRYFQTYAEDVWAVVGGSRYSTNTVFLSFPLACPLRAIPTLSGTMYIRRFDNGDEASSASPNTVFTTAPAYSNAISTVWNCPFNPGAGLFYFGYMTDTTSVTFDAEL